MSLPEPPVPVRDTADLLATLDETVAALREFTEQLRAVSAELRAEEGSA